MMSGAVINMKRFFFLFRFAPPKNKANTTTTRFFPFLRAKLPFYDSVLTMTFIFDRKLDLLKVNGKGFVQDKLEY